MTAAQQSALEHDEAADRIAQIVAQSPPLTDEQIDTLVVLLGSGSTAGRGGQQR